MKLPNLDSPTIDEVRGSPVVLRRGLSDHKTKKYDLSNQTRAFAIARLSHQVG